jgi:glycosyltransferase involved in cell wall biosynthesis
MHHIYHGQRGKLLQAPARYLRQGWQTWTVLLQERPDIVFVQNPPIFCALLAFFYARRYHAQSVIDSHTAAFTSPKWTWSLGLHRLLSRRAAVTIVHNESQAQTVKRWGCRYCVLGDPLADDDPTGQDFPLTRGSNVAVISTFGEDEPLEIVMETASRLHEVNFYVTGDCRRIAPGLLARKPDNCYFTGYLPYEQYASLLRRVDFVLDLTTRDNCLLSGAFEAVSVGTPLIISDWPILREYFPLGTVHVFNTVQDILEGVRRAQREQPALRKGILQLREQMEAEWKQRFAELCGLLQQQ